MLQSSALSPALSPSDSTAVHDALHRLGPLRLQSGAVLPEVDVAYATYGRLAPGGDNAILVTHGYTASHRMLAHGDGVAEGSWAPLIGPGRVLDTDRYFIVCSNMLGSCYGSTGPASIDPRTGRVYGPDFPDITLQDIVQVQHQLLQHLGVQRLRAVVGPSYGGFQALQWALDHPDRVDAIAAVVSAPFMPPSPHMDLPTLYAALQADPGWNAGRYAEGAGVQPTLHRLRQATLQAYGMDEVLRAQGVHDAHARQARIDSMARAWAAEFDAHSLIVLLKAALAFDVRPRLHELRCQLLHVTASTDLLFPPVAVRGTLAAAGTGLARYVEMDTAFGHQASGPAHALWSGALQDVLDSTAD
ncbi:MULTISPECIES: alpha/beta fold hydrolase [unclassified Acidovorax]|uniref:alpha/beta fold hydrolase n=1 Tax=unclassified Acidovorax TaxID=2684926 RepID=UPI0028833892|nr:MULTISPECIES: alpha/beta fold hydrolase [unclassified Acidovorax]